MSLYNDLGVDTDASAEEITQAYRRKAKESHPDAGGNPEDFSRVSRAAAILRDPERRAEYDRTGKVDDSAASGPEAMARDYVLTAFSEHVQAFVNKQTPWHADLIATVKNSLRHKLQQQQAERRKGESALLASTDAASRLTHKGAGGDILGTMLARRIAEFQRVIETMKECEAALERAIVLIDDWTWRADQNPDLLRGFSTSIDETLMRYNTKGQW